MTNNPAAIMEQFRAFMANPGQAMTAQRIPTEMLNDPNKAIQYLLDTGRISQGQYNAAQSFARQISQLPQGR